MMAICDERINDQPMPTNPTVSVIIPVFGNLGDLPKLVECLLRQTLPPHEILLVDSSREPLSDIPKGCTLVRNPDNVSLSWDYNFGAKHTIGDYILNMQQDCIPEDPNALKTLYDALTQSPDNVAAVGLVTLPQENFDQYDFWGKVLMARWVGRVRQGISGKFDLIRKSVFDNIGGYDTETFRFAGEDMDLHMRLSEQGQVCVTDAEIIHVHFQSGSASWQAVVKKHFQLAQSFGALFRRWGPAIKQVPYSGSWTHHLAKYLYPLLALLPFYPLSVGSVLFIGSNLSNMEAWRIRSPKTAILLVFHPLLFLVDAAGTLSGLLQGKQTYSVNK
ncbi:MAG: GT2 family glycosyltransferase [Candidatus Promineifilaceae bacterium]|jgi:GT2 family glycosyltransferase